MHADAGDREDELVGGERLRLDLSQPGPVERVREVGAECREVEVIGAAPDLLVDRERDTRRRPRRILGEKPPRGSDDDRDPGLVVGAEERGAVARHDVVAALLGETRHVLRVEHLRGVAREHDRLARPGAVDDRLDPRAGRCG